MADSNVYKVMNCMQCRKRKARCDRKIPCGFCRILGKASECVPMTRTVMANTKHSQGQSSPDRSNSPIYMPVDPESSSADGHDRLNHIETLLLGALNEVQSLTRLNKQQDNVNDSEPYAVTKRRCTGGSCDDVDTTALDRLNLLIKLEHTVMGLTSENEQPHILPHPIQALHLSLGPVYHLFLPGCDQRLLPTHQLMNFNFQIIRSTRIMVQNPISSP